MRSFLLHEVNWLKVLVVLFGTLAQVYLILEDRAASSFVVNACLLGTTVVIAIVFLVPVLQQKQPFALNLGDGELPDDGRLKFGTPVWFYQLRLPMIAWVIVSFNGLVRFGAHHGLWSEDNIVSWTLILATSQAVSLVRKIRAQYRASTTDPVNDETSNNAS